MRLLFLFSLVLISLAARGQSHRLLIQVDSLVSSAQYEQGQQLIQQNLSGTDPALMALLQNRSAEISILQGRLEEAETQLKAIGNHRGELIDGVTETNLGFLYLNKARFDLSLEHLQMGLNYFQGSGNGQTIEAAKCLSHLSLLYWSTGKLNQAEENGRMALQIRQTLRSETSEEVAASYNDLGLLYASTDVDKALEYYERAQAVYQKLHEEDHPKMAIARTNIGFMYQKLKLFGDAINNFESAEGIWKKIYPQGHPNQALVDVDLALTYKQMGNVQTAMSYFEKALSIYRKSYGEKHPDISNVLNQIGVLKLSQNLYDEALNQFQEALCANSPVFNDRNTARNPAVTDYYGANVLLYSLRLKAEAFEARHYGKTLKPEELRMSLTCLHACDSLIDDIRYHSSDENDKLNLGSSANEVYEDGVRIAEALSQMTFEVRRYQEEAFYFAEKSKSAVLQAAIADSEAKSFAGIPPKLLDEERDLKASIALLTQKLSQKPDPEEEKKLREAIFAANRQYREFVKALEKNYPDYFNLKFNQVTPSIPEIQKLLPEGRAVVSYFIAETGQRLYTFVITPRKFKLFNSTLPSSFDRLVKGFNNSLYYSVATSYEESVNGLSPLLLRGWPSGSKEIIVIPSGRLGTMPFEALSRKKVKEGKSPAYLIESTAISYEFSVGLFLQKSRGKHDQAPPSIFLCAPVKFPEKDNLAELPGTSAEVDHIASLFPSGSYVAKGTEANEGLIKSGKLTDYRFLHLATHGIVDENSPELSRIFLQSDTREDGNLFSGEVFNLHLNADLAVLSACQTGLGKFSKGEGVIGLSRALVYAGARNIIVSYWSVADESTSQLMTNFYKNLLAQPAPDFSKALQASKKQMIGELKYAAPYFWAPFVLIGY